jgi:hypothetical protein
VYTYGWGVQEMSTESHRIKMGDLWALNGTRGSRGRPCSLISKPISVFTTDQLKIFKYEDVSETMK